MPVALGWDEEMDRAVWYGAGGFAMGLVFPILGTALAVWASAVPFSLAGLWALHRGSPEFWLLDVAPFALASSMVRVGQWRARQRQAVREHAVLETILAATDSVLVLFDERGLVRRVNAASERVIGFAPAELAGRPLSECGLPDGVERRLGRETEPGEPLRIEAVWRSKFGARRQIGWCIAPIPDGGERLFLATGTDITERHELRGGLLNAAYADPLTGLANRVLFDSQLARALGLAPETTAVIALDLQTFREVNQRLGHTIGDQVLRAVAWRLLNATRGSDTVARLESDSFAVIVENLRTRDEVDMVARRLLHTLSRPLSVQRHELTLQVGLGVAWGGAAEADAPLLQQAEAALGLAKAAQGGYVLYDPLTHEREIERVRLEKGLQQALEAGHFSLHYQPILELEGGDVRGLEALLRWDDPEQGMLRPSEFIPVAEASGLIVPIGRWVLREACRQLGEWQRLLGPEGADIFVSVNLSPRQLHDADLVGDVLTILAEQGVAPESLVVEITESMLMHDPEAAREVLAQLREIGVRVAVDDFGTGYSSLAYLRHLPVDILKLDRGFAMGLGGGDKEERLLRAVLSLGYALDMEVIAEGIEHAAQADTLGRLGCPLGQGYHLARPQGVAEITRFLHLLALRAA